MNILPMNKKEADQKHWVVKWLRIYGYVITTCALLAGMYYGYIYRWMLFVNVDMSFYWLFTLLALFIGGVIGLAAGLALSLPCWGMAMVIDDLHAMRQYMQGFVVIGDRKNAE